MATFYVLPPRPVVLDRWLSLQQAMLPGSPLPFSYEFDPIEGMLRSVELTPGLFVLFRDDLPDEEETDTLEALRDGFGAEPGDQVVEVRWRGPDGPPKARIRSMPRETCWDAVGGLV